MVLCNTTYRTRCLQISVHYGRPCALSMAGFYDYVEGWMQLAWWQLGPILIQSLDTFMQATPSKHELMPHLPCRSGTAFSLHSVFCSEAHVSCRLQFLVESAVPILTTLYYAIPGLYSPLLTAPSPTGYYTPVIDGPAEPCQLGDYKATAGNATSCSECRKPGTTLNVGTISKHDW